MKNNSKKTLYAGTTLVFVAIILCLLSKVSLLFIHAAFNPFFPGLSYAKTLLFLGYLLVLFIIALCYRHKEGLMIKSWHRWFFIAVVCALYILNISSFFVFIHQFNLRPNDYVTVFNNYEISATRLVHNHVMKGSIAIFSQFFHKGMTESYDDGTAFLHLFPTSVYIVGAILGLILLFWSLFYFRRSLSDLEDKKPSVLFVYVILYAAVSFAILQSVFDGGLLSYEALMGLTFLIIILFFKGKKPLLFGLCSVIFSILLLTGLFKYGFFIDQGDFLSAIYGLLNIAALAAVLYYFYSKERYDRLALLLTIQALVIFMGLLFNNIAIFSYNDFRIGSDGATVATYEQISAPDYSSIGSIGKLNMYHFQSPTSTPETVGQVVDQIGERDNYHPVSVPWKTCVPTDRPTEYGFTLLTNRPLVGGYVTPFMSLQTVFPTASPLRGWYSYNVVLSVQPCVVKLAASMQEFFRSENLDTFFVYHFAAQSLNDNEYIK